MFIDEARVKLRAGNGGNGCVSFRREKFLPRGGPDGGNGGNGGSIILECDENVGDLRQFHFKPHWEADNGGPGRGSDRDGANGKNRILKVPPGTVVRDQRTEADILELLEHGQREVLLKGGNGGWGNLKFKSSVNRAPRQFKAGEPGQQGHYQFILKTLADVGLVGFPNAGKSTLTGILTAAEPKVGAYPFTTLHPNVGVIHFEDGPIDRLTMADIPGLISGAHENRGLGHRFLRHIERCPVLLVILDMAGIDGREPADDFGVLQDELRKYAETLVLKPMVVAANKMDEPEAAGNLKAFQESFPNITVVPISCLLGQGLNALKDQLSSAVESAREAQRQADNKDVDALPPSSEAEAEADRSEG